MPTVTKQLFISVFTILVLTGISSASVPAYGQCGGQSYSGNTQCDTGSYCKSYNPWYYQCVPGIASSTAAAETTSSSSTRTLALGPLTTTDSVSFLTSSVILTASSILSTSASLATSKTSTVNGAALSTLASTKASSPSSDATVLTTKYFMIFGDSYSSTGFWIGGEQPSTFNPIGNPAYPGTTWTGGVNWVGSITSELNTSLVLTYNFAEGGATTDRDLVRPYSDSVDCLDDQVATFVENLVHEEDRVWDTDNTVAVMWIGVNDIGEPFFDGETPDVNTIMNRYFEMMQQLYDVGVRNFRVLNVPPFDQTPLMLSSYGDTDALRSTIDTYNAHLATSLAAFADSNSHSQILPISVELVDTRAAFYKAISNPAAYGAPDATCINSIGKDCLWADSYHPGYQIGRLVATAVMESL